MAHPVVLVLLVAALAALAVVHSLLITLPRLLAGQMRAVWRAFGPGARTLPEPDGEPAVPVYARVTAGRDLRAVWRDGLAGQRRLLAGPERLIEARLRDADDQGEPGTGCAGVLLFPVPLVCAVAVVLCTAVLSAVPLLLSLLAWAVGAAVWGLWWAWWAAVAHVLRALRPGVALCPHRECGRTVERPVVGCPTCRAGHRRLVPGRYGALLHRCRCGTRLPTLGRARRRDIRCPHCARPLPAGYERARVVLFVGDPARRGALYQRALDCLGAGGGDRRPLLLRTAGRLVLLHDPPGDPYAGQWRTDWLDALHHADGLVLCVGDVAPHSADVRAVHRVLHALAASARRRPRRVVLLFTPAVPGDDAAVRRQIEEAGGGHLLRALDTCGGPVRCVAGADDGTRWARALRWSAAVEDPAPPRAFPVFPPDPGGAAPRPAAHPRQRLGRGTLLLTHVAGFLALPLTLVLLETRALPPGALFGAAGAYDTWRRPLTESVRQVDLTAAATHDWPRLTASHSGPGHPPSAVLPGHDGSWSVEGTAEGKDWLRIDFGLPLPVSEMTVDFEPDSVGLFMAFSVEPELRGRRFFLTDRGHWRPHREDGEKILTPAYGYDIPVGMSVDAVRVHPGGLLTGKAELEKQRLREINVRWRSSDALRLRVEDGGRLRVENTTNRELAVRVRPPVLAEGVRAVPSGRPPRVLGAGESFVAHWRLTGLEGGGRVPVAHAVEITEDGHTVTARCLGLLDATGRAESLC